MTTAARDMPLASLGDSCGSILDRFVSAVSRKVHGSVGTYDVLLPLTGTSGIECRTGGADGSHDRHSTVHVYALYQTMLYLVLEGMLKGGLGAATKMVLYHQADVVLGR